MSNEQSKAAMYNPSLLERAEMALFVFVTARRLRDAVYDAFLSDTGRTTAGPAAG